MEETKTANLTTRLKALGEKLNLLATILEKHKRNDIASEYRKWQLVIIDFNNKGENLNTLSKHALGHLINLLQTLKINKKKLNTSTFDPLIKDLFKIISISNKNQMTIPNVPSNVMDKAKKSESGISKQEIIPNNPSAFFKIPSETSTKKELRRNPVLKKKIPLALAQSRAAPSLSSAPNTRLVYPLYYVTIRDLSVPRKDHDKAKNAKKYHQSHWCGFTHR